MTDNLSEPETTKEISSPKKLTRRDFLQFTSLGAVALGGLRIFKGWMDNVGESWKPQGKLLTAGEIENNGKISELFKGSQISSSERTLNLERGGLSEWDPLYKAWRNFREKYGCLPDIWGQYLDILDQVATKSAQPSVFEKEILDNLQAKWGDKIKDVDSDALQHASMVAIEYKQGVIADNGLARDFLVTIAKAFPIQSFCFNRIQVREGVGGHAGSADYIEIADMSQDWENAIITTVHEIGHVTHDFRRSLPQIRDYLTKEEFADYLLSFTQAVDKMMQLFIDSSPEEASKLKNGEPILAGPSLFRTPEMWKIMNWINSVDGRILSDQEILRFFENEGGGTDEQKELLLKTRKVILAEFEDLENRERLFDIDVPNGTTYSVSSFRDRYQSVYRKAIKFYLGGDSNNVKKAIEMYKSVKQETGYYDEESVWSEISFRMLYGRAGMYEYGSEIWNSYIYNQPKGKEEFMKFIDFLDQQGQKTKQLWFKEKDFEKFQESQKLVEALVGEISHYFIGPPQRSGERGGGLTRVVEDIPQTEIEQLNHMLYGVRWRVFGNLEEIPNYSEILKKFKIEP